MDKQEDDLKTVQPEIENTKEQDIVKISYPHKHYLQEMKNLYFKFLKVKEQLVAGKMDFAKVEKLLQMANACGLLHALATAVVFPTSEATKAWYEGKDEADLLLYDMKEGALYACREYPELLAKISYFSEGSSNADTFQDLLDYSVFGNSNKDLFEAIGYDMENFKRAAELAKILSELYAQVTVDRSMSPGVTLTRDKGFTILKKLIDELNAQARFIFRADREIASVFMVTPPKRKPLKKSENVTVTA